MNEFWQTFLIAIIPSAITAVLSFLAALKASNTQIKAIREQNKADIQKLVEQNRVDIEKLKEQYKIQADMEELSHAHKLEIMNINSEMETRKDLANTIGNLVLSIINLFKRTSEQRIEFQDRYFKVYQGIDKNLVMETLKDHLNDLIQLFKYYLENNVINQPSYKII